MNLIFFHSKKKRKNRWKCPIPNFGLISTKWKYFSLQKKISLSFYTSKTIEKTLGHLILRTFAIFNPTYGLKLKDLAGSRNRLLWDLKKRRRVLLEDYLTQNIQTQEDYPTAPSVCTGYHIFVIIGYYGYHFFYCFPNYL